MPQSYEISVLSPCQGDQTVNRNSDTVYSGTSGDFTFANLGYENGTWRITIYDYRQGSNCFGASTYQQVTPDADPTSGQFGKFDANAQPDVNLGVATVE